MARFLALCALILLAAACSKKLEPQPLQEPGESRFAAGEVWEYLTRPNEPDSRVTILKVDHTPKLGNIVHIRVDGLAIAGPGETQVSTIEHMVLTEEMLGMSVTKRAGTAETMPDFSAAYARWRDSFVEGRDGGNLEGMVSGNVQKIEDLLSGQKTPEGVVFQ